MNQATQQQNSIRDLIAKGKEQGFLTYAEVNDHLPDSVVDPEQIEDIVRMINDMGHFCIFHKGQFACCRNVHECTRSVTFAPSFF